jgi:hypothetical protein
MSCTPGQNTVPPNPHYGEDTTVWNLHSPSGSSSVTAPAGGQILDVKIKGCAVEDTSASSQQSQGVPVNDFNIVTEAPGTASDGKATYQNAEVSSGNLLPFCGNGVSNSTITTYHPIHLCVAAGQYVSFHDIGGFIPYDSATGQGPWYPQGVPMMILAPAPGAATDSFVAGADNAQTMPDPNGQGNFASEPGQQVMMQIIEGTGDDAYGLCPGGHAIEGSDNTIVCVQDHNPEQGATPCGCYAASTVCNPQAGSQPAVCYYTHQPWTPAGCPSSATGGGSSGGGSGGSGGTGGGSGSASGSATPPTITKLKLNPPKFHASRGATITHTDSEAGTATDTVYRYEPGIRRGHGCTAVPRHRPRQAVRCRRTVRVLHFTHADHAGGSGYHLGGLQPGSYLLTVTSTYRDLTGLTAQAPFTVTRG